ncbi:MAG TPA: hypothetical protein VMI30_06095 [Stellaceae bacterium]|nr:hypothetical protein [Stellaceae bacterium]
MNDPVHIAAFLAIRLIEADRRTWKEIFAKPVSRTRLEKLIKSLPNDEKTTIEPYTPYLIEMIFTHFKDVPDGAPLPREQEIVDWVAEQGGTSALLLKRMTFGLLRPP